MATSNIIVPPNFDESKMTWREYRKEVEVWASLTSLSKEKQGPALWMALKGKAKEAIKEMEIKDIKADSGLEVMMTKLDELFKTDDNQAAYLAYRDFEIFLRPQDMNFQDFVVKFESLNSHIKRHKMDLPDGVLAYRFLHSANLKEEEMKLCRATINEFSYKEMKSKVLNMCGDKVQSTLQEPVIKSEPVFYGENRRFDNSSSRFSNNYRGSSKRGWRGGQKRGGEQNRPWRSDRGDGIHVAPQKQMNPPGPNGKPSQCAVCGSRYHWARECPENQGQNKSNNVGYVEGSRCSEVECSEENDDVKIGLYQDSAVDDKSLQWFLGETLGCAVVDSGCSKTVAGSKWLNCFLEMLDEKELEQISRKESNQTFKFGKGDSIKSCEKIVIPVTLGQRKITIESDIVDADIPLLLSKDALKKAETILDFNNDIAIMFGQKQTLIPTESGHYAIPLSITTDERLVDKQIVLINSSMKSDSKPTPYKIALKLHRQFCHCRAEKLIKLIRASSVWDEDEVEDIVKELRIISANCDICKLYKKTPSVPVVSVPLAASFNEVVAMDLISVNGVYILHLIDLFTRYSAACVRNTKRQEIIVDGIMKMWISYFGKPKKFLADNGGEFSNESYKDMCTSLDIEIMKTAAESPWSNGTVERHNGILKECILKTMEDSGCTLESATAWSVSGKNTLSNQFGYSSNILVFGRNPSFPSVITDKITALSSDNLSKTVEENLNAMRSARKAFIESESSERIKRALTHNVRSNTEAIFEKGDKVFYKRNDQKRWYGPAAVIGQEGKTIIVKNGGETVRVHVSRIIHVGDVVNKADTVSSESAKELDSSTEFKENGVTVIEDCDLVNKIDTVSSESTKVLDSSSQVEENSTVVIEDAADKTSPEKQAVISDEAIDNQTNLQSASKSTLYPKVNTDIAFKLAHRDEWRQGNVYSRAGKVGGRHESCFNIKDKKDDQIRWYDFKTDVEEWEPIPAEVLISATDKDAIIAAKQKEIENWKNNDVFEEVPYNNQHTISTRWVITTKEKDSIIITKARLVARGFEDNRENYQNIDSPTCSRESLSLTLSILSMKGWKCWAIDIKTAFLQGNPLNRDVYLQPPREFNSGMVWKLKKAVYGLNEASRCWYNRVKDEFLKAGLSNSKYDEALFYLKTDNQLQGVVGIHVDDFIYGGNDNFISNTVSTVKSAFEIGTETSAPMKFVGINITQERNGKISFSQEGYLSDIKVNECLSIGDKKRDLNSEEQRSFRGIIGQLNWISSRTNPLISFDVCQLSTKLSQASGADYHYAKKVAQKALKPVTLHFSQLKPPIFFLAYCDASFANLPGGSSQGAYVIFLSDSNGYVSPITWGSKKLQRVCRSSLAAEVMAILDTVDITIWLRYILSEIFDGQILTTVIRTDNKSSYENIHSTTPADEKRTRVDIAAIRESVRRKEVSIEWIRKEHQLADVLTKQGADSSKLAAVLEKGHIHIE